MFSKWLLYTVLCGAIPILGRLAIYYLLEQSDFPPINPGDIIAYGLVLHITMLNSLDNFWPENKRWTTIVNGTAIFGIVIYAILFTCHTLPMTSNNNKILLLAFFCIIPSVLLGALIQFLLTRPSGREVKND